MEETSPPDAPVDTQSRFWVGSLIAGCCFALGYGITERVLTLQNTVEDAVPEAFTPLAFPGDSLQDIRARFGDYDPPLQMDVTALEAVEAAIRPVKPAAKTTPKPDLALQTPDSPVWTTPAWSEPQTIAPVFSEDVGPASSSVQDPELDLDDSNADTLVLPEDSTEAMPVLVVPEGDSPILVAEPQPAVLPPGAEAFFETIEPVIPPQP